MLFWILALSTGGWAGEQVTGSGGPVVVQVREKTRVSPPYPREAWRLSEEGVCEVDVSVGADGVPISAEFGECPDDFKEVSREAALASSFYPREQDGQPTVGGVLLRYHFSLPSGGAPAPATSDPAPLPAATEPLGPNEGALVVTVTDTNGLAIPGAIVTVKSDVLPGGAQARATDGMGSVTFALLPPGAYTVTGQQLGFEDLRRKTDVVAGTRTPVAVAMRLSEEDIMLDGQPDPFRWADAGRGAVLTLHDLDRLPNRSLGGTSILGFHPAVGADLETERTAMLHGVPVQEDALPRYSTGLSTAESAGAWFPSVSGPGLNCFLDSGGGVPEARLSGDGTSDGLDAVYAAVNGPLLRDHAWFSGVVESVDDDAHLAVEASAYPTPDLRLEAVALSSAGASDSRVSVSVFPDHGLEVQATSVFATSAVAGADPTAEWLGDARASLQAQAGRGGHFLEAEVFGADSVLPGSADSRLGVSFRDAWMISDKLQVTPQVEGRWRSTDEHPHVAGKLGAWLGPENGGVFGVVARRFENWSDPDTAFVRRDEALIGGGLGHFFRLKASVYGAPRADESGTPLSGRANLQLAATTAHGVDPFPGAGLAGAAAATWRPELPGFNEDLPLGDAGILVSDSWVLAIPGPTPGSVAPAIGIGTGAALLDGVVKGQFAARLALGFDLHRTLVELGVEGAIGSPAWLSNADAETLDTADEDPAAITPLRLSLRLRR